MVNTPTHYDDIYTSLVFKTGTLASAQNRNTIVHNLSAATVGHWTVFFSVPSHVKPMCIAQLLLRMLLQSITDGMHRDYPRPHLTRRLGCKPNKTLPGMSRRALGRLCSSC